LSDQDQLNDFILLLSECSRILVEAGCSSNRLENLLVKLGDHWDFEVESLALPTGVSIMVRKGKEHSVAMTRIRSWQLDLDKIQRINDTINQFNRHDIDVNDARKELQAIAESPPPYPSWVSILAGGGASAGLVYFLGGNTGEVMVSFPIGCLTSIVQKVIFVGENRRHLGDFLSSLMVALLAGILVRFFPELNEHRIVTGGIIVLIPGLVFLNAIHEIALKNLVSGTAKMFESLVIGVSLSFGIAAASGILSLF